MLYIALTFDYELYFGENYGGYKKVLMEPTEKIRNILIKNNVSSTFFVDVCSVFRHSDYGLTEYCDNFERQICRLYNSGQDIQLHIHAHWLNSQWDNEKWVFSDRGYRIHDFGFGENGSARSIIHKTKNYLDKVLKPLDKNYSCCAYRAGGYCIQPYEELIQTLASEGIIIDSSVSLYSHNENDEKHYYDFSSLPGIPNFWLSSDKTLANCTDIKTDTSFLFEIPIGYYKQNLADRIFLNKNRFIKKGSPLGRPVTHNIPKKEQNFLTKLIRYNNSYNILSLDGMSAKLIEIALERIYKDYNGKSKDVYLALIGHPKAFTGDAYDNLDLIIKRIIRQPDKYRIVSIRGIADDLRAKGVL